MMRIKTPAVIAIALVFLFLSISIAHAQAEKKAVVVIFDGIALADIKESSPPNLLKLIEKGGIGLMNVRSGRQGDAVSGYLTVGAGAWAISKKGRGKRSLALKESSFFEGRKISDIYLQQRGRNPTPGSIVVVTAPLIIEENMQESYGAEPGAMAEALEEKKKRVALLGNADTFNQYHREAALIAMDKNGLIEEGETGRGILNENPEAPFGLETNYGKLLQETERLIEKNDLIVIEMGDTARVNRYRDFLGKEALERARRKALLKGDQFLGRLVSLLPSDSLVLVISPNPPPILDGAPGALTPVIVAGSGIGSGLLTSPTTRQTGLVTNTDIAPTILNYFGAEIPASMTGRSFLARKTKDPLGYLSVREEKIAETATFRRPILTAYVATVFILLVLAGLSLFYPIEERLLRGIRHLLAWQLSVPLSLLILPSYLTHSIGTTILMAICISVLITFLAWIASRRFLLTAGVIAVATSAGIVLDLFLGSPLMKNSLLGYDPLIGARFYGIGNEYMGVLLGSTIAGVTIFQDVYFNNKKGIARLMAIFFILLAGMVGYSRLGANIGGAIAAAGAFFITYLRIEGKRIGFKNILLTAMVIASVVFLIVGVDFLTEPSNQSHAGRAVLSIGREGYKSAVMIVKRKIATNLKLIQWTIWSKVFIASLAIFALLFSRPIGLLKRVSRQHPHSTSGVFGIVAGSIIALLFNDSGIVAAATMIIFGVVTLLYLAIE